MARRFGLLLTVLMAALLTACSGGGGDEGQAETAGASFDEFAGATEAAGGVAVADEPDGGGDGATGDEGGEGGEGGEADGDVGAMAGDSGIGTLAAVSTGDKIIKQGTITIEVGKDSFERAFEDVLEAARRLGGSFVASTAENGEGDRLSGSVTVRVPVEEYERLLVGIRRIGEVRSQEITSEDVTTEFVDLRSRLRQQQAQERFYLGLLERAKGVRDAIAVQQQLQSIQADVERIQGRLQYLEARTAYSTLTVELFEPGAPVVATAPVSTDPSWSRYWQTATRSFVAVTGTMLVSVVALLPLLLPLAIAFGMWRVLRRRPTATPPTETAPGSA